MASSSWVQQASAVTGIVVFILTSIDMSVRVAHRQLSIYRRLTVSRVQLALNVPDIDEAVTFYSKLFSAQPNKRKPGYANFAIADPPLKLVLFETKGADAPRLNHLGVEVETTDAVTATQNRLRGDGIEAVEENGTCCYATQDKVWVDGP